MHFRLFPRMTTTRGRRGLPRTLVVVLLALQALLWGGGSILEARAAAESLTRYSHVEDQDAQACPPIHSHLDCLICRTFASGAITAKSRDLLTELRRDGSIVSSPVVRITGNRGTGPLGSRAPPASMTPDRTIA
jgi:hypothetical protein